MVGGRVYWNNFRMGPSIRHTIQDRMRKKLVQPFGIPGGLLGAKVREGDLASSESMTWTPDTVVLKMGSWFNGQSAIQKPSRIRGVLAGIGANSNRRGVPWGLTHSRAPPMRGKLHMQKLREVSPD